MLVFTPGQIDCGQCKSNKGRIQVIEQWCDCDDSNNPMMPSSRKHTLCDLVSIIYYLLNICQFLRYKVPKIGFLFNFNTSAMPLPSTTSTIHHIPSYIAVDKYNINIRYSDIRPIFGKVDQVILFSFSSTWTSLNHYWNSLNNFSIQSLNLCICKLPLQKFFKENSKSVLCKNVSLYSSFHIKTIFKD